MSLRFWIAQLVLAVGLCAPRPAAPQSEAPAPTLDVNRATAEEFERLPGIGATRAAALVRMRERNGPFRSIEELRALPRLPEKVFQQLRKRVFVTFRPDDSDSFATQAERR